MVEAKKVAVKASHPPYASMVTKTIAADAGKFEIIEKDSFYGF
jgi:hypothetical protein